MSLFADNRRLIGPDTWPYLLSPLIPAAVIVDLADVSATVVFFVSAVALIPPAAMMGRATEELAERSGNVVGGLLNVTFGNAPELIIALFALGKGLHEVVKASLIGSILGNVLLVMGGGDAGRRAHREPEPERAEVRPDRRERAVDDAAAGGGGADHAGRLRAG